MNQSPTKINLPELIDLFKHSDTVVTEREGLFIPVSVAILPATVLAWEDLSLIVIIIAGASSIGVYIYYLFIAKRGHILQDNIVKRIIQLDPSFEEIVIAPRQFRMRYLRVALLFVLIISWIALAYVKHNERSSSVDEESLIKLPVKLKKDLKCRVINGEQAE